MREIRFRAWSEYSKEMYLDVQLLSEKNDMYLSESMAYLIEEDGRGDYSLMQYTGLKDKNGEEIWEGDVVIGKDYGYHKKGRVIYKDYAYKSIAGCFGVEHYIKSGYFESNGDDFSTFYQDHEIDCEVIGNIYENPELLIK